MTFPRFHRRATNHQAFTLVELLVAIAVLGILILFLGQVIALTSQGIAINSKKLDSAGQSRLFFDRLAIDLAARPRRADLGMLFTKAIGSDNLQFYSAVDGYTGARQIAWVSYQITQPTYQLERASSGTDFSGGVSVSFLPQSLPTANNSDYQVMANGIFRLEFCYLLNTGVYSNSANSDYSNVEALVVAVAILDSRSLTLLHNAQIGQLSEDLPDTTEGHDPLTDWNSAMTQTGFASGIPSQAVQNIRLYERVFYVP